MMKSYFVVSGIVRNNGKVLILKRPMNERNYPGKWSACAGFSKEFESAEEGVLREIKEETGLDARIVKKGSIVITQDKEAQKSWVVFPFLCESDSDNVTLCEENEDYSWIKPQDIKNYDTVPGLIPNFKMFNLI